MAGKLNAPTELDLYAVLDVDRSADGEAIRKQYKLLAKTFHPDVNPDPAAIERMKALNDAYYVLGDAARRAAYDSVNSLGSWWEHEVQGPGDDERALRKYEAGLDNELSTQEALVRRRGAAALIVRKTGYRAYQVASLDQTVWYPVEIDKGCHCQDAAGAAGPFGCKHWYAVEGFRNNGDKPVESRRSA